MPTIESQTIRLHSKLNPYGPSADEKSAEETTTGLKSPITLSMQGIVAEPQVEALGDLFKANNITTASPGFISVTVKNGEMTSLELRHCRIRDLSALSGITTLKSLDLYSNQVTDTSVLGQLTDLEVLVLAHNSATNLSGLSNCTKLRALYLGNTNEPTGTKSSDPNSLTQQLIHLKPCLHLREINLYGCSRLTSLGHLTDLPELNYVDARFTQVSKSDPLAEKFSGLRKKFGKGSYSMLINPLQTVDAD